MIKDSKIIKDFLNYKYSHFDRQKYYRQLESTFKCINYGQEFLNNVETFSSSQHVKVKKIHRHLGSEKQIDIASRLKESRWMNLIRKINIYLINVKRTMKKNAYELYQKFKSNTCRRRFNIYRVFPWQEF